MTNDIGIAKMVGMVFSSVTADERTVVFETEAAEQFIFAHDQRCCESVKVEDICGELGWLVGSPLTMAEEVISKNERHPEASPDGWAPDGWEESYTWTFYKFATVKGYVTIRWFGQSNGYYSESVDMTHVPITMERFLEMGGNYCAVVGGWVAVSEAGSKVLGPDARYYLYDVVDDAVEGWYAGTWDEMVQAKSERTRPETLLLVVNKRYDPVLR